MTDETTTPNEPVATPAPEMPAAAAPAAAPADAPTAPAAPVYAAAPAAAPVYAPAVPASTPHRRWPMWVAAVVLALVLFGTGIRVGVGIGNRFGRGLRANYAAAAPRDFRGAARGFAGGGLHR